MSFEPVPIFILGTAGSGKSTLTHSLSDFLLKNGLDVATVNLDLGADYLPYEPDIDARDYVDVAELMKQRGLGPNSALMLGSDLLLNFGQDIKQAIGELEIPALLIDMPGQVELFALRASGSFLATELFSREGVVLFLFDGVFSQEPLNLISNIFLSSAVYARFLMPQINVLTKKDLMDRNALENVGKWISNPQLLLSVVRQKYSGEHYLMASGMLDSIASLELSSRPIIVSSTTFEGFLDLKAGITRISFRGEDTPSGFHEYTNK